MTIEYALEPDLAVEDFRAVLVASTLGTRRPVEDMERLVVMVRQADLIVTAREAGRLVGVSRAITDFSYCCYLSDLAVDEAYQRRGIGKRLIQETHTHAGPGTCLILTAAPTALDYYGKIGMEPVTNGWIIPRGRSLT